MMVRRSLLVGGFLLGSAAASAQASPPAEIACAAPAQTLASATTNAKIFRPGACDTYSQAVMAYVWGMPFVDSAKIRVFFTQPDDPLAERPPSVAGAALNRFGFGRVLADPVTSRVSARTTTRFMAMSVST